jgi:hypothetical protein
MRMMLSLRRGDVNDVHLKNEERQLPTGLPHTDRLAVPADAREEAGCEDAQVLRHLRCGGNHVRVALFYCLGFL